MHFSRRRMLRMAMALPGAALLGQDRSKLIVRSANPEDFEMPVEGFLEYLTPVDRFFVRTHLYKPQVELSSWKMKIGGLVDKPIELNFEQIKAMPAVDMIAVLECAGNGRSFYRPIVTGMQWQYGGVGNGQWRGVRLSDVLKRAGVKTGATEVLFNGADIPPGTMPDFQRTLPLAKAMHPDTMLAYELNGKPLPMSHGFPVRLIPPGWAGDSWMKWVTDITLLDKDFDGFFMKTAYRRPIKPVAPGTALDPTKDMTPVTSIRPKTVIAYPLDGQKIAAGPLTIKGAGWSGESPVAKVEVSGDSGRTWQVAKLDNHKTKYGWRLFEATVDARKHGSRVLMARATDASGDTQPLAQDWNQSGYLYNVPMQVRVEVGTENAPPPPMTKMEIPEFPAAAKRSCLPCHGADIISTQHLTPAQWDKEVDKMVKWGAKVPANEKSALVDFLSKHFK